MNLKRTLITTGVIGLLSLALAAFVFFREPAAATEPIQAIPLNQATTTDVQPAPSSEQTGSEAGDNAQSSTAETNTGTEGTAGQTVLFELIPAQSEVSFAIDEDLRGSRTTAVGTTNQVAGQIALDPADLSTIQVGKIQVNARTLATDESMRNRAIQNFILDTNSYEYITFTPTAVEGLPDSVDVGETVSFTIVGDLTIRDLTQQVSFGVTATLVSETELSGTAQATVSRSAFELSIPSVRQVANVADEVLLTIDFAAGAL